MKGIVYVLSHEAMPGLLKVGYTTRTIKERLQELSSTGVPGSFIPELYFYIDEPHVVEREIHQHLSSFRYEKEFFRVDKTEAIKIIRSLIDHKNLPTDYFFGKSSELASDVLIRNQREVQREREIINESNKLSTLTYTDLKEKYMQLLSSPNATLGLREAKKLKPFLRAHEARISLDRQQQHATNLIKYEAIKPNFLNAIAAINKILLQHVPSKLFGGFFGYRSGSANLNSAISANSGHHAGPTKDWRTGVTDGQEISTAHTPYPQPRLQGPRRACGFAGRQDNG